MARTKDAKCKTPYGVLHSTVNVNPLVITFLQ